MSYQNEINFLEDILEVAPGSFQLSTPIDALENWDSINILTFMAHADERYGVSITASDLEKVSTVQDLLDLLKKRSSE